MDGIHETPRATPNFRTELAEQLAELMPEVVADGKIDVEKLKELLAEDVGDEVERFGLFWPGKRRAIKAAQEPTTATLRPDKANSKDWDTTQNVFVEGDNLEVLKILQSHYHGKIKMIYIDPPYNTGQDFVYPDNYKEGLESYLEWTQQVNEEGKKVSTNSESEGRYHSNWLNMMYPRLKLARNLLADDGVIFISIDDSELENLLRIVKEIFGEDNFLATVIWEKRFTRSNNARTFASLTDYVIAVRKSSMLSYLRSPRTEKSDSIYSNPDSDPRGPWTSVSYVNPASKESRPNLVYPINNPITDQIVCHPTNAWKYEHSKHLEHVTENRLYWGKTGENTFPRLKKFLTEVEDGMVPINLWKREEAGTTDAASKDLATLMGGKVFDFPKPIALMKLMLGIAASPDDSIILDFFAGSGTMAHAVMEMNAMDGGTRKWICVQLPEPTPEDSDARKAGFKTISSIATQRISLAGVLIHSALTSQAVDVGYRKFSLTDTNFAKWRVSSDTRPDALQLKLSNLRDSASDGATPDDLLTELLLKNGYSLTERIAEAQVAGLDVRIVGDNHAIAYLTESVKPTLEQVRAIVNQGPARIIMLEDAFQGDDELKTNLVQLCKTYDVDLITA